MKHLFIYAFVLGIFAALNVSGQTLQLDNSFGNNGVSITLSKSEVRNIQEQTDGKIISAGYYIDSIPSKFQVIRYNANASFDMNFALNGVIRTVIGYYQDYAENIAIQNDGKIVVSGGYQDYQLGPYHTALCRYQVNGQLDSSFGLNGILRLNFGTEDGLSSIQIQADQKIVIGGYISNASTTFFALARFQQNGSLDSTFGNNGLVTTNYTNPSVIYDLEILQDDKILVCGYEGIWDFIPGASTNFALAKYNSNGALDNSFGNGGSVLINVNSLSIDCATGINELSNGDLLISGFSADALAIIKLKSNGTLDNSFGQAGKITYASEPVPTSTKILTNGKILISGNKPLAAFDYGFNIVQLNANGTLDSNFATNGVFQSNISNGADYVQSTYLLSGGQYLCAGSSEGNNLLAQYAFVAPNSINEIQRIGGLKLYPNPCSNEINLEFELSESSTVSISLINSVGQTIELFEKNKRRPSGLSRIKLSLDSFTLGNYFLLLEAGENRTIEKITIH